MTRRGLLALLPATAHAGAPSLAPPPGAALPPGLPVRDGHRHLTLGDALGGLPAVFAFADYGCTTLCGTSIGLAAAMLPGIGLVPGRDYRLVVLGMDPADGPAEAAAMRHAWLGETGALAETSRFLLADAPAIEAAMAALGYHAVRRGEGFDHPLALFVLRPDGRLGATLPALGAEPEALRAALRDTGSPGLLARMQLACTAAAAQGGLLRPVLAASGLGMIGILAGGFVLLRRWERRA
jgi:protein SCO1/2